jgi:hypothetical protein
LGEFLGVDFGVVKCPVCGREGVLCVELSHDPYHTHKYLVVVHGDSCKEGVDTHRVPLYLSRLGQCLDFPEAREIIEVAKLGARADDPYIVGNKRLRFVTSSGKKEVELSVGFKARARYGELFTGRAFGMKRVLLAELRFLFGGGDLADVVKAQGLL